MGSAGPTVRVNCKLPSVQLQRIIAGVDIVLLCFMNLIILVNLIHLFIFRKSNFIFDKLHKVGIKTRRQWRRSQFCDINILAMFSEKARLAAAGMLWTGCQQSAGRGSATRSQQALQGISRWIETRSREDWPRRLHLRCGSSSGPQLCHAWVKYVLLEQVFLGLAVPRLQTRPSSEARAFAHPVISSLVF